MRLILALSLALSAPAHASFVNPDVKASGPALAFPSALGFGKIAKVRGPNVVVYKINSLLDVANPTDGLITFRECATAAAVSTPYAIPAGRPRICVFDVAGQIVVNSEIRVTVPGLHIAGQSSPGGIEIRMGAAYNPVNTPLHIYRTSDVIIRHMRFRLGEHPDRLSKNGDNFRLTDPTRVIMDHVSAQYATDGSFDFGCGSDCTAQWVIMGPNVCRNAGHESSSHCKTALLAGHNVTITKALSQHGVVRGMNMAPGTKPNIAGSKGQMDTINNVIYAHTEEFGLVSNNQVHAYVNYIGNVAFRGPNFTTRARNSLIGLYASGTLNGFRVYAKDNVTFKRRLAGAFGQTVTDDFRRDVDFISTTNPLTVCWVNDAGLRDCSKTGKEVVSDTLVAVKPGNAGVSLSPNEIVGPEQAMRDVLARAGADRCSNGPCRDNVDAKFIEDVTTCDVTPRILENGVWPSRAEDYAGWGVFTQGPVPDDTDKDGMPDSWESRFRNTNPLVFDANADPDGDGYSNLEEYLADIAGDDETQIGAGKGPLPAYNCGRPITP